MSSYRRYCSFAEAEEAVQNLELSNTVEYLNVKRRNTPVEPDRTINDCMYTAVRYSWT